MSRGEIIPPPLSTTQNKINYARGIHGGHMPLTLCRAVSIHGSDFFGRKDNYRWSDSIFESDYNLSFEKLRFEILG